MVNRLYDETKEDRSKLHLLKSKKKAVYSKLITIDDFNNDDDDDDDDDNGGDGDGDGDEEQITKLGSELDSLEEEISVLEERIQLTLTGQGIGNGNSNTSTTGTGTGTSASTNTNTNASASASDTTKVREDVHHVFSKANEAYNYWKKKGGKGSIIAKWKLGELKFRLTKKKEYIHVIVIVCIFF